jgi:PAS domain S-box-containing protein
MGSVGGALMDPAREANVAEDLVERILNGEDPAQLKPVTIARRIAFDARQLQRYRIAESRLPVGSEVLFRAPSAWDLSRPYLLAGLLFLLLETALVAILLIQRRRARRAQTLLERRFDMERVISEYATRLSSCPAQRVDEEIERGLEAVLEVEKLDVASWMVCDDDASGRRKLYSAQSNALGSESPLFSAEKGPWADDCLTRGQAIVLNHLNDLPPEAQTDKQYLQQQRIKSLVCIPSSTGDATRATLLLACRETERIWPRALVNRMSVMGNIFANALMRKRAQEASHESERRFRSLFTEAPIGIALEDLDGKLLFVNPALCSMLGYTMEEMTTMTFAQFSEVEDDVEDLEQFQKLRAGTIQGYHIEKRYRRRDGVPIWGRLNVSLIKGSSESAVVLATVEDITEKKAAVEDLVSAHTQLQVLTRRLLATQEEERKRIARELHDDIGQRLSLLMMELDLLKNEMPVDRTLEQTKIHSLLSQLDELISDVHNMSHELHSSKLQHLGLSVALKEICRRVSTQRQVAIELKADPILHPLPEGVALCFYRVAQEALSNAVRHSGSPHIEVRLTSGGQTLRMQIRDFGIGFDPTIRDRGLGLATMHERLKMIGGKLLVHSSIGGGTELIAEANLERPSAAEKVA